MNEKKVADCTINFDRQAFAQNKVLAPGITAMPFTKSVVEWNELIKPLDRHDSFARLLIEGKHYAQTQPTEDPRICYGIPPHPIHKGGAPVLTHQQYAAQTFLKELRGFGLLADVVGSGKTFEAGIVLSELAARDRLSSALFIVPKQVYGDWVRTMECFFGMGHRFDANTTDKTPTVLKHVGRELPEGEFVRDEERDLMLARGPMIVTTEDFARWSVSSVSNKLFDIIVVDEAHRLNDTKGEYAQAMYLLSLLMNVRKKMLREDDAASRDEHYCLLLSATPHKGNLAEMFRLWYFVRCVGGTPKDFNPETVHHTEEFIQERSYYLNVICDGAVTITDFVRKRKIAILRGGDAGFCADFRAMFPHAFADGQEQEEAFRRFFSRAPYANYTDKEKELVKNYIVKFHLDTTLYADIRQKFSTYLEKQGCTDFDLLNEGRKERIIDEFLNLKNGSNRAVNNMIAQTVKHEIAASYHERVLGSIMVRQSHDKVATPPVRKRAINLCYFRTDKPRVTVLEKVKGYIQSVKQTFDLKIDPARLNFMNAPDAVTPYENGKPLCRDGKPITMSFSEYVADICRHPELADDERYAAVYAELIKNILTTFSLSDADSVCRESDPLYGLRFPRKGSLEFLREQLSHSDVRVQYEGFDEETPRGNDIEYCFEPVYDTTVSDLDFKYQKLCDILRHHKKERVIVFFDYNLTKEKKVADLVYARLLSDPEFKGRVLDLNTLRGSKNLANAITEAFDAREDAVFVVEKQIFTEGANLQSGHVIVNFQMPLNPLDMQQKIGRAFRIGQENDVLIYSLVNLFDLEGYLLPYYTRIGLMSGNTGDAEILAGCNNENMVAIRCKKPGCGHIELISKEDYDSLEQHTCPNLNCNGAPMSVITTRTIRCSNKSCSAKLERESEKGKESMYHCLTGEGYVTRDGDSTDPSMRYYCPKICAIAHCKRFRTGEMKDKCPALKIYLENPSSISGPQLFIKCMKCPYRKQCESRGCAITEDLNGIDCCSTCREATCKPTPRKIIFDQETMSAPCPVCEAKGEYGVLSPVQSGSFESFIRDLYQFIADGGVGFCEAFRKEIRKVGDIQEILRDDKRADEQ